MRGKLRECRLQGNDEDQTIIVVPVMTPVRLEKRTADLGASTGIGL